MHQVAQTCPPAVPPPGDVMKLTTVVDRSASRNCTGRIQPSKRAPLSSIGQPSGPAEIQPPGSMQHATIGDHHRCHFGHEVVAKQFGEHVVGHSDWNWPGDERRARGAGSASVMRPVLGSLTLDSFAAESPALGELPLVQG
jgi:hypothetical protein